MISKMKSKARSGQNLRFKAHLDRAGVDEIHGVSHLPGPHHVLPRRDLDSLQSAGDVLETRQLHVVEHRQLAEEDEGAVSAALAGGFESERSGMTRFEHIGGRCNL